MKRLLALGLLLATCLTLAGQVKRTASHAYVQIDGKSYPAGDTVRTVRGPDTTLIITGIKYSQGAYHYPIEITYRRNSAPERRITFNYPFCPPEGYGSEADTLLACGMPGVILSKTRWEGEERIDSVSFRYSRFEGGFVRPSAIMRADGDASQADTCVLYLAYDPEGRSPVVTRNGKGEESRQLEPRMSQWLAPDPVEEKLREKAARELSRDVPEIEVAPVDGSSYLFDSSGRYLTRIDLAGTSNCLVMLQEDGRKPIVARFADPVEDPTLINLGTKLHRIGWDDIYPKLVNGGVFRSRFHGLMRGCLYLLRFSGYGGRLDFSKMDRQALYLTSTWKEGNVAHNNFNYGNFLWGASARELEVPLWVAQLGSHVNNFYLSPDTQGTLDSEDDQFSIATGHHWRK